MLHLQKPETTTKSRPNNESEHTPLAIPDSCEDSLYEFECAIDLLDRLSDALIDDPTTANALNGLHGKFCEIYNDFKTRLIPEME